MKASQKSSAIADWAIVTPSYSGDFRRCKLLCQSLDRFVSGSWHHYIVVGAPDYELFKQLTSPQHSILLVDDVLPEKQIRLFKIPFFRGRDVWWSRSTGLSIGWHVQQMVKIAMASYVNGVGLIHCDSDMFFVRPFDVNSLQRQEKLRFYREANRKELSKVSNPAFVRTCLKLLGLPLERAYHSYVDTLVVWRRQSVLDMCNYLGLRFAGNWQRAFKNKIQISEYNLYGLFVDEVAKDEHSHFATSQFLCKTYWAKEKLSGAEVANFFNSLAPHEVAICFQSFAGVDMDLIEQNYDLVASKKS